MRTVTLVPIAIVLLFLAPPAVATWLSYGTFEPDTPWDDSTFMQQDAPGSAHNKVYFNAYPKWGDSGADGAFIDPNVGALGTRFDPAGPMTWQALLGVWTDCNGDGYIGLAETAAREYSARALLDTSICPAQTGVSSSWPAGANNYNGWVTELIPIGSKETKNLDKRVYKDDDAMVWGDPGQPNDDVAQAAASCPVFPLPGDAHSTGGLIRTIDCRGNRGLVAQFNSVDSTAGTHLGFSDPSNPQDSTSPLNQPTFGDDSSDHSAVHAQDCSQDPIVATPDTLPAGTVENKTILRPVPASPVNGNVNSWTVPGTLNETIETFGFIPSTSNANGPTSTSNCDYTDDSGNDFYGNIEANAAINQVDGKRNAQWNLRFNTASRGTLPATLVGGGNAGAATDLGVELLNVECPATSCLQSYWGSAGVTYTPPIFRGTLTDGTVNGDETTLAAAPHWSWYAYVGTATTSRGLSLPGGSQRYGNAQCGSFTSGEHHGWNCDASQWYVLADGSTDPAAQLRPLARVGQTYLLRDVDCYDGSISGTGVGTDPAFFGTQPC